MSIDSSLKLLEYISKVSKQDIFVEGTLFSKAVDEVTLNSSFFLKDDCQMCGKCCPNEDTVWTNEGKLRMAYSTEEDFDKWGLDYQNLDEISEKLQVKLIAINRNIIPFYYIPKDSNKDAVKLSWKDRAEQPRCHWLFEKDNTFRCRIHPVRSITCGMPHCRMYHNKKTHSTTIGLSQFGRNWALKCPVEFKEYDEESINVRIMWLRRLHFASMDCHISTYLPEILEYLESGGRHQKVFQRNTKHKLFDMR